MSGVVVVGAGAAGIAVALRLSESMPVILLCKSPLGSGSATAWAQGGIAAAVGPDDSPTLHAADTERVGGGLNDHHAVEILASDAAERIAELIALGASFDRTSDGSLALGQEAAHSRRRILHAGGDATGREVLRALIEAVRKAPVTIVEATADELVIEAGRVVGIRAYRSIGDGHIERFRLDAEAVVLATGGCGHLFALTTNPPEATGDGIALAARAGADLIDLEFVQFHPTALAMGLDPMPLVTEALRGEGARLIDADGNAIMAGRDPRGDLAPRDVVARVVFEATVAGRQPALDVRGVRDFATRFPTVFAETRAAGLNPEVDPLPIGAAAHYHMGGITVSEDGRSSIPGLWACGETASTGAHGANRLASNSLLEAIVFAARVADDIRARAHGGPRRIHQELDQRVYAAESPHEAATHQRLRQIMYCGVGVIRDAECLSKALLELDALDAEAQAQHVSRGLQNMILVGRLIARAALARRESRGSHQRRDFPLTDPRFAQRAHLRISALTEHHSQAVCSLRNT